MLSQVPLVITQYLTRHKHCAAQVAGTFHLQLGAFKALEAEASGKLATKSLHTELVYSLAGHKYVRPFVAAMQQPARKVGYCFALGQELETQGGGGSKEPLPVAFPNTVSTASLLHPPHLCGSLFR